MRLMRMVSLQTADRPRARARRRHLAQPGQWLRLQQELCQESQSRAAFQDVAAVRHPLILIPEALMV